MTELYDHILSLEAYTVRLGLALTGVSCARRIVDYRPAETPPAPAVLPLNPDGTLPVLVDAGLVLCGVAGCLRHVGQREGVARGWYAAGERDAIAQWIGFATGPLAAVSGARNVRLFAAAGDAAGLERAARAALLAVEDHLTDGTLAGADWLVGVAPTLADVAVFAPVMLSHDAGIGHEEFPAINLWQRRVRRLPGFIGMPGIPDYF